MKLGLPTSQVSWEDKMKNGCEHVFKKQKVL